MRGQELVPGEVRLSLPVPSQAQKWPEGPEKAKIAGCCWWGKVGFTCQGEVGQAQPHTCSSLPFHLCLTSVRVIKEGSGPRGWVKDLLGLPLCWWHLGTHPRPCWRCLCAMGGDREWHWVTSALPAASGGSSSPQSREMPPGPGGF